MKNVWRLFVADLKSLKDNVIALVVVIGLAVVPALYAWFNTLGFWDPYSETGAIAVAVANEDEGYRSEAMPETINAGDEVVATLRANDQFKWEFVDETEATEGVDSGRYYAAIVIPKTFSEDLMTVFSTNPEPATIVYYTNQKENAIAPRLTDQGATTLSVDIDEDFTKAVTNAALSASTSLTSYLNGEGFSEYTEALIDRLSETVEDLQAASAEATAFADLVDSCITLSETNSHILDDATTVTNSLKPLLDEATSSLNSGADALESGASTLTDALGAADEALGRLESALQNAQNQGAGQTNAGDEINKARDALNQLKELSTADIDSLSDELASDLTALSNAANQAASDLATQNSDLSTTANSLGTSLTQTKAALESTASTLDDAATELGSTRDKLQTALDSNDWNEIRTIIGNDPSRIASFVSAPTKLEKIPVYPIANNGSAMSPFYTSLSLWIGAIFLVALVRTTITPKRLAQLHWPKPYQLYLGRYLFFALLRFIQATILALGNLLFLDIQCVHPWLYLLTCWLTGLVFSNVVYTLTVSFGRVGEAIAVILLVLQVGGSGGIFPVVMSGELFQVIYPFLPFTHSMEAFQSCIAGIYGNQFLVSIGLLLAMVLPMLLLGLVLRTPIIRLLTKVTNKIEETSLFISE